MRLKIVYSTSPMAWLFYSSRHSCHQQISTLVCTGGQFDTRQPFGSTRPETSDTLPKINFATGPSGISPSPIPNVIRSEEPRQLQGSHLCLCKKPHWETITSFHAVLFTCETYAQICRSWLLRRFRVGCSSPFMRQT